MWGPGFSLMAKVVCGPISFQLVSSYVSDFRLSIAWLACGKSTLSVSMKYTMLLFTCHIATDMPTFVLSHPLRRALIPAHSSIYTYMYIPTTHTHSRHSHLPHINAIQLPPSASNKSRTRPTSTCLIFPRTMTKRSVWHYLSPWPKGIRGIHDIHSMYCGLV